MTSQKQNITTASSQYASRPADERFSTLDALVTAAEYDRDHSAERTYNLRDLRAVEMPDPTQTPQPGQASSLRTVVGLESPKGIATFTHWSFGQLAASLKAPAHYLRTLPAQLAADNLNHGLKDADHTAGKRANLLIKANGGTPIVRAATSDTYGRVWDAELYSQLARHFGDGARSSQGGEWQSPPTWTGEAAGSYRGDRDSFVIRIDGGSIVDDPRGFSGGGNGRLNRGILVRNSEVGACSITMECILFDFICGNHILWGAVIDRTFRRRHVGAAIAGKAISEILTIARRYNARAASEDSKIIRSLVESEIAATREGVIDELKKLGYSKDAAGAAYDACLQHEPSSIAPTSWWGIAAGTTRMSQESGWQDDRLELDQLAAAALRKGRQLVTV